MVKLLFIGDIFGKPGRKAVKKILPQFRDDQEFDLVIANGENLAGGLGLTKNTANEMFDSGVDVLTSGNHLWDKRESIDFISEAHRILKPANYPSDVPGKEYFEFKLPGGKKLFIVNLMGRTFTVNVDCPFQKINQFLEKISTFTPLIFVDFHAEATAEKKAFGWFLDGRVSAVVGTHTHVQTADERILPRGTAYITDAGMTGPHDSVIGVRIKNSITRFRQQIPNRFIAAKKNIQLQGVSIQIDETNGQAQKIKRIVLKLDNYEGN